MMNIYNKPLRLVIIFTLVQFGLIIPASGVFGQQSATPLSVTGSGIEKIKEMIAAKKLDREWANKFKTVSVSIRNTKGFTEYVLKFTSTSGSPSTVSLFVSVQ